jgi:hypothetical protein
MGAAVRVAPPGQPVKPTLNSILVFPPPARNPLVQVLSFGALIQGVQIFLGDSPPGSTEQVLPPFFLYGWGVGLIAFWALLVIAALVRDVVTGVLIEGVACAIAVLATAAYAVGAFTVLGRAALVFPVLVTTLYGPACAIRLWVIIRDVRRAHRILQSRRAAQGE